MYNGEKGTDSPHPRGAYGPSVQRERVKSSTKAYFLTNYSRHSKERRAWTHEMIGIH